MKLRKVTQTATGALIALYGLWALALLWLFDSESRLLPLAYLLAIATFLAGVVLIFRPRWGLPLTILTLVPQAISFAGPHVAFALNIWPSFRLELDPTANPIGVFFQGMRWTPQLMLRTDENYVAIALGIDFVSTGLIVLFSWLLFRESHSDAGA